jgi:hypothetical protein
LQLGVLGDLRLVEQHAAFWIEPAGDQRGNHFTGVRGKLGWIVGNADRVKIGEEIKANPASGRRLFLKRDIVADRPQIVSEVRLSGGLDARDYTHESYSCGAVLRVSRLILLRSIAPVSHARPK